MRLRCDNKPFVCNDYETRLERNMANTSHAYTSDEQTFIEKNHASDIDPMVLTQIYQEHINLAIWQNELTTAIEAESKHILTTSPHFKAVLTAEADNIEAALIDHSEPLNKSPKLCQYIGTLVDMFSTLFELKRVGLRISALDKAMCPKFHVDNVPCRLVTTFTGPGSQWLENAFVDRSKLGAGSLGIADEESGIMPNVECINQLSSGDVALFKGEGWFNNQGKGIVHRSPAVEEHQKRLVLTLDFME